MIARPVIRPRPIPFTAQAPGARAPHPVSWASSSGPAPVTCQQAANEASNKATLSKPLALPIGPKTARAPSQLPCRPASSVAPSAATSTHASTTAKASGDLRARYLGHGALSVRSSVTGRHYRFQGHGDSQKIDKHDMLMLKRIPDLVVG